MFEKSYIKKAKLEENFGVGPFPAWGAKQTNQDLGEQDLALIYSNHFPQLSVGRPTMISRNCLPTELSSIFLSPTLTN